MSENITPDQWDKWWFEKLPTTLFFITFGGAIFIAQGLIAYVIAIQLTDWSYGFSLVRYAIASLILPAVVGAYFLLWWIIRPIEDSNGNS